MEKLCNIYWWHLMSDLRGALISLGYHLLTQTFFPFCFYGGGGGVRSCPGQKRRWMDWMAAIVSEPAASRGSSTGRMKAGQMAAGTARARWGFADVLCVCMHVHVTLMKRKGGHWNLVKGVWVNPQSGAFHQSSIKLSECVNVCIFVFCLWEHAFLFMPVSPSFVCVCEALVFVALSNCKRWLLFGSTVECGGSWVYVAMWQKCRVQEPPLLGALTVIISVH